MFRDPSSDRHSVDARNTEALVCAGNACLAVSLAAVFLWTLW
ncbi:hypothetical protein [Kistimonas scapharcae]